MPDDSPCQVSFDGFAQYVAVRGPARVGVARRLARQITTEYHPGRDQYRALRHAAITGTVKGGLSERLGLTVRNATGSRAASWPRLAGNYQRLHDELGLADAAVYRPARRTWPDTGLVKVNPPLAARYPDGRHHLVVPHWRAAPPVDEAITAMLRVAELAYAEQPDLVPVLLDVPRGTWHAPAGQGADLDEWLRSEAASLADLLSRLVA